METTTIAQPPGIRSIWDNGGRSADRYTIVTDDDMGKRLWAMLGMSDDPEHGFSQWGECTEGSHLGRRVRWEDLPQDVQAHAARRLTEG